MFIDQFGKQHLDLSFLELTWVSGGFNFNRCSMPYPKIERESSQNGGFVYHTTFVSLNESNEDKCSSYSQWCWDKIPHVVPISCGCLGILEKQTQFYEMKSKYSHNNHD